MDTILVLLALGALAISEQPFYFTIGACAVVLTIPYVVKSRRQ